MKLEGLPRHSSTHAAGVVIGDRPLAELVPLYRDPRSDMPVTQFDMKYRREGGAGEVRFSRPQDALGAQEGGARCWRGAASPSISTASIWDDPAVYDMLQRGDTVGVFQLEFGGDAPHARRGEADQFRGHHRARLALSAGADGQSSRSFGARKNGREAIDLSASPARAGARTRPTASSSSRNR